MQLQFMKRMRDMHSDGSRKVDTPSGADASRRMGTYVAMQLTRENAMHLTREMATCVSVN